MTDSRPNIGITRCSAIDDYVESVTRAGGRPVILEVGDDPAVSLARIDGLLLTGGPDVDPAEYGEPPHSSVELDRARDAFEMPLTRKALATDMPMLAICRGIQVLNVAAGGTLMQDIPSAVPSTLKHTVAKPKDAIAHSIDVRPSTKLANVLHTSSAGPSCAVNSRHHQSIARVASDFVVSAVSPDGVVEAIERPSATFCLGVQWHPENFWRTGEFDRLFDAFVDACRSREASADHLITS